MHCPSTLLRPPAHDSGTLAAPRLAQSWTTWRDASSRPRRGTIWCCRRVERAILYETAAHVRQRAKVYETWGFAAKSSRGLGISALFSGPSGTGKTMAAEVLANELQLDLYHIDLSQVVSKYIGETEKNLRRVFDAAEEGGAILFFDEADALFGKRSEVKDSHDRYANIEVSYLLQRMEAYRGLAILTTNMKKALDTAFLRRIRFIVHFPFPDVAARAEIWQRIFPVADADRGAGAAQAGPAQRGRRQHSQHRAQRRVSGGRRRRAGPHGPPARSGSHRIRQTRKVLDQRRDQRLGLKSWA